MMRLADKISLLRKQNGLSQEELAERLQVSRQSVSKWEGAQSTPDLDKLLRLSEIFGVSTDYLLKDEVEVEANPPEAGPAVRRLSMEEADAFLQVKASSAKWIGLATLLCILSPVCLLLLGAASETGVLSVSEEFAGGMGMIVLLLFVAAAVAIFITAGYKTAPFAYLEKEIFETAHGVTDMVREQQRQYSGRYTRANLLGTLLCILSVIPLFAGSFLSESDLFLVAMLCVTLLLAGIGVWFFIAAGIRWASMQKLLQEGNYARHKKKSGSVSGAVGTAYWLVVTAVFLAYSLYTGNWEKSWILWPVAGVLFAAVMILCAALQKRGE